MPNSNFFESNGQKCRILRPCTYMNLNGTPVRKFIEYYKIPLNELVVIHDELDFNPGEVRIKKSGGTGGHNGLNDLIKNISSKDFYRIRIGIGHPKNADMVSKYVLGTPNNSDKNLIDNQIELLIDHTDDMIEGNWQKIMNICHQKQ